MYHSDITIYTQFWIHHPLQIIILFWMICFHQNIFFFQQFLFFFFFFFFTLNFYVSCLTTKAVYPCQITLLSLCESLPTTARQWLGKHIPTAMNTHATIEELSPSLIYIFFYAVCVLSRRPMRSACCLCVCCVPISFFSFSMQSIHTKGN
jgi:hypothetical protein